MAHSTVILHSPLAPVTAAYNLAGQRALSFSLSLSLSLSLCLHSFGADEWLRMKSRTVPMVWASTAGSSFHG